MTPRSRLSILLSDGSGLTSRQVAAQCATAGHVVDVLAPTRLGLARFTRDVRRVHRVPAFGLDPAAWLDAALEVLRSNRYDVLVPTQEQVAILARDAARVRALGVAMAVPSFASLLRVQDEIRQAATLDELALPCPPTWVARSRAELVSRALPPVYLKAPIGTASLGVRRVNARDQLLEASRELDFADGIVVQQAVHGPLAMIQAVFDDGRLVAWHANLREREGSAGGASIKRSTTASVVGEHLVALGAALRWHGALSLDAIFGADGPRYIDINPRLVEPGNARCAGVDLVGAMVAVSLRERVDAQAPGRRDVRTRQTLLAILGAAQHSGRRGAIAVEMTNALTRRGPFAGTVEELTPLAWDPLAAVPLAAAAIATLVRPAAWTMFARGAVSAYALTPAAWRQIIAGHVPDDPTGDARVRAV